MAHAPNTTTTAVESYLRDQEQKSLLRFITCGSVDDGKSTLIGRLLFESKMIFDDQLTAVEADSKKYGTQGEQIDFALLVDGLAAEREQGITIDVAYRYFSTDKRKFIVADTPGHEQYTRNMVTGASNADLAVVIVDARKGVLTQTRRHTYLVSLLGIKHIVVAVNKMDLVDYSEKTFNNIVANYASFAQQLGLSHVTYIPISALKGDNITAATAATPWYNGSTLMGLLETIKTNHTLTETTAFRLPVQWVNRPNLDFRGYAGSIASGIISIGDQVHIQPSGKETRVTRIVSYDGDLKSAQAGQSITLTLEDEIDISRGNIISSPSNPAEVADQFTATVIWMHEEPLLPGRPYLMKIGTNTVGVTVTHIKHQVNVNTLEHIATKKLELNAVGICNISLDRPIAFDPYEQNRNTGGFIFIDRLTNNTMGAGLLQFALRRAHNIHFQHIDVDKAARSALKMQPPCIVWFTGISGSGKSTIANLVEKKLLTMGRHTYLLDGDNIRHGLNKDLGFTSEDRVENIRRIAEVSKLMVDAGLIVLTAFISPFRAERQFARSLVDKSEFLEVFIDTPLAEAEARDTKGLYKKARQGQLHNFTGIDSPYEPPEKPEIHIRTLGTSPEQAAEEIVNTLNNRFQRATQF